MAAGFTTGQPFHAAMYVFAVASMAYLECTRNPGKDLVIALTDKQKTTLTPEGISFHFPELLSVEEDSNDRDVTIHIVNSPTIILNADPDTYDGPWGISSERIGIPFTGLDALIRHFTSTPRTVHSWPHLKASTSSMTSSRRPTQHSQPHKGATHEHQETHPRDADRRGPHPPAVLPGLG